MNIFAIDNDPRLAAKHLVDRHCVKMVLESAQMLANCFSQNRLAGSDCPRTIDGKVRKHCHFNHPCSKWVRQSRSNMNWLISHAKAIDSERMARYGHNKPHFVIPFIDWCSDNIDVSNVAEGPLIPFAQAMPEEFKRADSVEAYRDFYRNGKKHLHVWTRNRPTWIDTRE